MNLLSIAWKSVRQRSLPSLLTGLSVALGVMLMVLVMVMSTAVNSTFAQNKISYDLIIGPKGGSPLQLVLSAVFRIEPPIENLPYLYYLDLCKDPRIEHAVPLAFGDHTKPEEGAFPIVGTTDDYFTLPYAPKKHFSVQAGGKRMGGPFDAVIGSEVAEFNNWNVGSQFVVVHGAAESGHDHEDTPFTVVAVLTRTGTSNDRTVFMNLDGFYQLAGHEKPAAEAEERLAEFYAGDEEKLALLEKALADHRKEEASHSHSHSHSHEQPDILKEVTAVYIKTRGEGDFDTISLQADIQKAYKAMAVNPVVPINRLQTGLLGWVESASLILTGLIIVVSGISIFVSIYNSMSERRREIAVMRALGAQRSKVFAIILTEAAVLCVGGGVLGWLLGHGLARVFAPYISRTTGLLMNPWSFDPMELVLFPALLALALLVGFLPAITGYRTDVAEGLQS